MTQKNPDEDPRFQDATHWADPESWKRRHHVGDSGDHESTPEQRLAAVAARKPRLLVWTAATRDTYTICRPDGHTVAHDRFHPDLIIDSEDAATESAALQGIWLAALARGLCGADVATVRVVTARAAPDPNVLRRAAFASGLVLDLAVDAVTNPATEHRRGVWVDWRRVDLTSLIQHPRRPQ
ncbi:hypothetical protein [Nocardia nova]|uniref:hypothetical protein n=1 Tax=Nocardia nova TaxID=37330 RepID=UPI003400E013